MAWSFTLNLEPATDGEFVYNLKEALKTAGRTVTSSGDATNFSSSSDVITTAAEMNTTDAWFVIEDQNGYQWCFQNVAALRWSVSFSKTGVFTGGSATVRATATDEVVVGPDSGSNIFGTDNSYRQDIIIGASGEEYSWLTYSRVRATGVVRTVWWQDGVVNPSASDPYPVVLGGCGVSTNQWGVSNAGFWRAAAKPSDGAISLLIDSAGTQTLVNHAFEVPGMLTTATIISAGYLNPYSDQYADNTVDTFPMRYVVNSNVSPVGPRIAKGESRLFRSNPSGSPAPVAFDQTTTRDRTFWGFVSVPWDGVTVPNSGA
jgi:hypothetical protein